MKVIGWRSHAIILVASFIVGGIVTSYFDDVQQEALMPLRNALVLGEWSHRSEDDIPTSRYRNAAGINPVHVAQTVREDVLIVLQSGPSAVDMDSRNAIIYVADHFVESGEDRRYEGLNFKVWPYHFDWPQYGLEAPWISGMAQGFAVETLLAAGALTGDEKYLAMARLAANALRVPIDEGGAAVLLEEGIWFEEYAGTSAPPSFALNGHNFALNGVWHLAQTDTAYVDLLRDGTIAVLSRIGLYDASVWSMYDLRGTPANRKYHRIHVRQMKELYARTSDPRFLEQYGAFRAQLFYPVTALFRLILYPNKFLIIIYILNVTAVAIFIYLWMIYSRRGSKDRRYDPRKYAAAVDVISPSAGKVLGR